MPSIHNIPVRRWLFRSVVGLACVIVAVSFLMTRPWSRHNSWKQLAIFAPERRVRNFRSMDDLFPSRVVHKGEMPHRFDKRERALPKTYTFRGETRELDRFLDRTTTTGLLVLQGNTIVAEHYYRETPADAALTSWSVVKSVVSVLVGIARDQDRMGALTTRLDHYAPELKGSAYGEVTLRDALTMSSGIAFDERYQRIFSDINVMFARIFYLRESARHVLASLPREVPPGTRFHYASVDTFALGLALRHAVGKPLAAYLEDKIWKPLGMEYDASWNVENENGMELAFCCLNARLRDWAKFGRLLARRGDWDGQRIVSQEWIEESTRIEPPRAPGKIPGFSFGYQYQWWIPAGGRGAFMAAGVWGQYIYINPRRDVVIVKTSVDPNFLQTKDENVALFEAIEDAL